MQNDGAVDVGSRPTSWVARSISVAVVILGIAYPLLVYSSWQRVSPRWVLGAALLLLGLRWAVAYARGGRSHWKAVALPWLFPAAFLFVAWAIGHRSLSLYWPVVISFTLLFAFGRTLLQPPTLVERLARLQKPDLSSEEIAYCRKVTQLWCLFFIGNGIVAAILASGYSLKTWTLYNGLIAYILIGSLMTLEYVYRHWRFRPAGAVLTEWMNRWTR